MNLIHSTTTKKKQLDPELQLSRAQRSQSVMSSVSLQDSQLPFYDAIEYFTSDTESDDDSDQESDADVNESNVQLRSSSSAKKSQMSAIVPGKTHHSFILFTFIINCPLNKQTFRSHTSLSLSLSQI